MCILQTRNNVKGGGFEGLETKKKRSIPTDRAQKVDENMGSFVCLSCLLPELWSLKC